MLTLSLTIMCLFEFYRTPIIEDIIRRMIFHLQAGLLVLRKTIDSYDSNGEDEDDGDTAKR